MTDNRDSLNAILRNDQALAEVNALFTSVVTAFKYLRANGVPEENAGDLVQSYGELLLNRHFGVVSMDIRPYLEQGE